MPITEGRQLLKRKAIEFASLVFKAGLYGRRLPRGWKVDEYSNFYHPSFWEIDSHTCPSDDYCKAQYLVRFLHDLETGYEEQLLNFVIKHDLSSKFDSFVDQHRLDRQLSERIQALGMNTEEFISWLDSQNVTETKQN